MLVLTRKPGESIAIGDNIRITLLDVQNKSVKIGVQAPINIRVHREEIYQKIVEQNKKATKENTNGSLLIIAKMMNENKLNPQKES